MNQLPEIMLILPPLLVLKITHLQKTKLYCSLDIFIDTLPVKITRDSYLHGWQILDTVVL